MQETRKPTRRQADARTEQRALRTTMRDWFTARRQLAEKRTEERREAAADATGSAGVDRVPARLRIATPAPEYLVQHHDMPRRERRARGILASSGNTPAINPVRDAKRNARLRKELRS